MKTKYLFMLALLVLQHAPAFTQIKYIRRIVYKNGATSMQLSRIQIYKLTAGVYPEPPTEFFGSELCDCSKHPKIKLQPKNPLYLPKEVNCLEIEDEIALKSSRPVIGVRTSTYASSFSGKAAEKNVVTFKKDPEVDAVLYKILNPAGLTDLVKSNRITIEAADVENAQAVMVNGAPFIYYNPEILSNIQNDDWASTGVFAHELAHHLFHQALDKDTTTAQRHAHELEADKWAGYILRYLDAPMDSALAMVRFIEVDSATSTHPSKEDRIVQMKKGWEEADRNKMNSLVDKRYAQQYSAGKKALENRNFILAVKHFDTTIDFNRFFSEAYLSRGKAKMMLGRLQEAITDLNKAIFTDSLATEAIKLRASCYATMGMADSALHDLERIPAARDYDYYLIKAQAYFSKTRYTEVSAYADSALALDSARPNAYYWKAVSVGNTGNYEEAIRWFDKAIDKDTGAFTLAWSYYYRAYSYSMRGNTDQAIADYSKSIEYNGAAVMAYISRAMLKASKKQWAEAAADWTKVIGMDSTQILNALYQRGCCYSYMGDAESALKDMNAALAINDRHLDALYMRAIIHSNQMNFQAALDDMNKVIQLNPNKMNFNFSARANYLIQLNRLDEAMMDIRTADSLLPNNQYNFFLLANAKFKAGAAKYDEALAAIDKAIILSRIPQELGPNYYLRGLIKKSMGDKDGACKDFQSAKINGNFTADTELKQLKCR